MRPESFRPPLFLEGRHVRLVPLDPSHAPALFRAGADPEVGRYLLDGPGPTPGSMDRLIDLLLRRQATGSDLAFTTVSTREARPVGMTRYLAIDRRNDRVEVGGTWLDPTLWRTAVNTESKYLLFRHAFEVEGVHRLYLKTDLRNERSARAIARLGAVRESALREHLLRPDGQYRTSVFYSVLRDEWPRVKAHLEARLAGPGPAAP